MWRMRVGIPLRIGFQLRLDGRVECRLLLALRFRDHCRVALGTHPEVHEQRRIAAVIENHVGVPAVRPLEDPVGVFPIVGQRLALPGEDRRAGRRYRRGGVVLGREDVAGRPAHARAERLQRLDEHRGLDGHVQGAGDTRAGQRLRRCILIADGHQARHLGLAR